MSKRAGIEFQLPDGSRRDAAAVVLEGRSLAELLRESGAGLNTRCGQRQTCNGCLVELIEGMLVHCVTGETIAAGADPLTCRACEYRPAAHGLVRLRIPQRSLLRATPQVVERFRLGVSIGSQALCGAVGDGEVGVAIDVGTTTVALVVVSLADGTILASVSEFNQQISFGDNVLTRIARCRQDPSTIRWLQQAVVRRTIVPLLHKALRESEMSRSRVRCVTVAGNTTMLHLLAGIDPSSMGAAPFHPAFLARRQLDASHLALNGAVVDLLPGASAFIGADVLAGIVASGMLYDQRPTMLVDLGTNGEIVLKHGDELVGAATAAGPAFEGVGLSCGMRACEGAIEHIRFNRSCEPQIDVIHGVRPVGICGSGYIDFIAQGREIGILTTTGRFTPSVGRALRIAGEPYRAIAVSESDIAKLLQAKAATAAGIEILLRRAGLKAREVHRLYLAGGFGMHLDVGNAVRCGLLPGFEPGQVEAVGNTALGGAYLALLDATAVEEMDRLRSRLKVLELNNDPEFENCFIDHLALP